jgi:hypothetical protein
MMDEGPALTAHGLLSPVDGRSLCFSHIKYPPSSTSPFRPIKQDRFRETK